MAELRPHVDELRRIGVEPYVIGSGTPEQARAFSRHLHADGLPIFSDSRLTSYRAADLKRSFTATLLHPSTWLRGYRALSKFRQGKTAGDPWQLGGAMMVRAGGEVTWRFRSEAGGDHPSIEALTSAAKSAVA